MRDLIKNPMFYYILAPILVGLWPLLVWGVYLPRMQRSLESDKSQYLKAESCMIDILTLDPGRINGTATNAGSGIFTYDDAINRVADHCGISPRNCKINVSGKVKISGKETQEARVVLNDVQIVQAYNFLSTIQSTWVNLECIKTDLKKKDGGPDCWDMDLNFKYTY